MPGDQRERILQLYHDALGRDEAARPGFLADACTGNAELRGEVLALLAQEPPSDFLPASPTRPHDTPFGAAPGTSLIGRQVGPYRVDSRLGAGGMGEVFRAHDTRLGRDVAIKVLPPFLSGDPERLARFEREAHVLASLNHPHIGAIHGLEDIDGSPALVLEFIEGETLSERIGRTARAAGRGLAVADAIEIARQLADALDAAHEKGVVHRDLKPANIKFASNGSVKVLDFGLAKLVFESERPASPSKAPTHEDTPTKTGVVMGTAAYMSPEQAKGERVDKRTDIWAFGCVLYEILTGRAAFAKASGAETIGAVLHRDADWDALPVDTPAAVRVVIDRCLQKDPTHRLRDMGDVQLLLTGALLPTVSATAAGPDSTAVGAAGGFPWRRVGPILALLLVAGLVATLVERHSRPERRSDVTRLSIGAHGAAALHIEGNGRMLTITPDGSRVVYVGDGGRRIFVRALNELEPVAIATGTLLNNPFVSPDGQWVGYGEGFQELKKTPIVGGPPITIAAGAGGILSGAVWLADNTIVYGTGARGVGLLRVSADGGIPQVLTTPDAAGNELDHSWPSVLPDGGILYTKLARTGGLGAARVAVLDLRTNTSTDLLTGGSNPNYLRTGQLAYVTGGTLWAVSFDAARRAVAGTAAPVLKQVKTGVSGAGNFAVSATGTLAYARTSDADPLARTLSWIDRNGKLEPLDAPPYPYLQPRLSHDGTRIVHAAPSNNIGVWDLSQKLHTRLRTDPAREQEPSWSPDDRWVLYSSNRAGGGLQIWREAPDGAGEPELLVKSGVAPIVTPDGTRLVFTDAASPGNNDILQMVLDGSRRVSPLVQTPFNENGAEVSPDGHWVAYWSNLSGSLEVYVRPYPNAVSSRWQVSRAGGRFPLWRRDGRELFFMALDGALMGVQVKGTGSTWTTTSPVKVLEPGYWSRDALIGRNYDVSPDGKRFLVVTGPRDAVEPPDLIVVQHWDEELKARMPATASTF